MRRPRWRKGIKADMEPCSRHLKNVLEARKKMLDAKYGKLVQDVEIRVGRRELAFVRLLALGWPKTQAQELTGLTKEEIQKLEKLRSFSDEVEAQRYELATRLADSPNPERDMVKRLVPQAVTTASELMKTGSEKSKVATVDTVLKHGLDSGGKGASVGRVVLTKGQSDELEQIAMEVTVDKQ